MREQVNGSWRIETHPKAEAGNVLQETAGGFPF